jgi:hypothetical protein
MDYDGSQILGSETAKQGFENEREVIARFNQWHNDDTAKKWLQILGYEYDKIFSIRPDKVYGSFKADIFVEVKDKQNNSKVDYIQVKLVSNLRGYNQIDKRWIDRYQELWKIPPDICHLLKLYTGELPPTARGRDPRRMFADEFNNAQQVGLCNYFEKNKEIIIKTIFQGDGEKRPEWLLVIQQLSHDAKWALWPISKAMEFFSSGNVAITDRGNIRIGKITVQRKGGDAGRETAKMLQFKINPAEILS